MVKKFILNADDLGISSALNTAVIEGYSEGILKSASLMANGEAFNEAIDKVIPQCPELGIGIHLNIIEGKSLCEDVFTLTDSNGKFNNSYPMLLLKSLNLKDKKFMEDVEREFRLQIEKILSKHKNVTHIDSHVHVHSIPRIFNLVCKLAKEYGIKQVRTQFEKFYMIPTVNKNLSLTFLVNQIKVLLLNFFTIINEPAIAKYELQTNDYLIGVAYTSMMDSLTVAYGLGAIKYNNVTVEALIHPCRYEDGTIDNHFDEYLLTKNPKLKHKIERLGYEITNYVQKEN